jgi:hypothetical protein
MASDPLEDIRRGARDVVYTGVGLSVLGFQHLQVRRRELERSLGVSIPQGVDALGRLARRLTGES